MIGLRLDSEARLRGGAAACGAARSAAAGAQSEDVVGGPDVLHGRVLAALLRPEERVLQHPARAAGQAVGPPASPTANPAVAAAPTPAVAAIAPATSPAVGARAAAPSAQVPEGPAHALGGDGDLCCRLLYGLRCATLHLLARCPASSRRRSTSSGRPLICGAYSAASWGSWERKACTAASPAPAPTRSAAACAPSAALRRRPVMEGGPCPLFVSASASGSPARSSSPKRFPPPWRIRAKSSSVASAGARKPSSGQRLVPLQVAHNLLEARALIEAVGPKRLHLFMGYCAATSPAARSTPLRSGARVAQLGYLAVHGLRQPAHVVQVPLPLLGQPALAKPVVEGPRLLQLSLALQQQRLQVVAGVRFAKPPEHLRLVARFDGLKAALSLGAGAATGLGAALGAALGTGAALGGHGRCRCCLERLGCCLGRGRCLGHGCCLGRSLGSRLGLCGKSHPLGTEGGVRLIRRLRGQDHFFSLRQVVDHFFALRQGQLGRLRLVFAARGPASRPWRRFF